MIIIHDSDYVQYRQKQLQTKQMQYYLALANLHHPSSFTISSYSTAAREELIYLPTLLPIILIKVQLLWPPQATAHLPHIYLHARDPQLECSCALRMFLCSTYMHNILNCSEVYNTCVGFDKLHTGRPTKQLSYVVFKFSPMQLARSFVVRKLSLLAIFCAQVLFSPLWLTSNSLSVTDLTLDCRTNSLK